MKTKKPKVTKAQLQRKVLELEANLACTYYFADAYLSKERSYVGSGVLLQLSAIGGKELIPPVMILDGLSPETIAAIRKDLARSYELATIFKPKGVLG